MFGVADNWKLIICDIKASSEITIYEHEKVLLIHTEVLRNIFYTKLDGFPKANKSQKQSQKKTWWSFFHWDLYLFIYWVMTTTGNRESKSPSHSMSNCDGSVGAHTKNTGPLKTSIALSMLVCFLLAMRRKWSWKQLRV